MTRDEALDEAMDCLRAIKLECTRMSPLGEPHEHAVAIHSLALDAESWLARLRENQRAPFVEGPGSGAIKG